MNNPKISIINNWVYIDGIKSKKKYMEDWYHSRDIFYNDLYVIKIKSSKSYSAEEQNLQERQIWKAVSRDSFYSKYFAPSIYCHNRGLFLVQKRIRFTSHARTDEVRDFVRKIAKKFGLEDVESGDNKNWGMIGKNHPIIFDYGV